MKISETSAVEEVSPAALELVKRMREILYADVSEEVIAEQVRALHIGDIEVETEAFRQLTATERRAWHTYFTKACA